MTDLPDDTKIYRIYSLPDLINTLHQGKIRLSQASRMKDKNELFGIYFTLIKSVFGAQSLDDIPKTQRQFHREQTHHYLTCWTQTHDNAAIWSLYSPNHDGIQVSTTYGALKSAVREHSDLKGLHVAYALEPNDPQDLFIPPQIGSVEYVDFEREYESIKKSFKIYFWEQGQYWKEWRKTAEAIGQECPKRREDNFYSALSTWDSSDGERRERIFGELKNDGALLKDDRYAYEQEVRFVLSLCRRDSRTEEEYEAHPMAGLDGPYRHPKPEDCPPNIFVLYAPSNFLSFDVDGRMPDWQYETVQHILSPFDFSAGRSSVFSRIEI